MGVYNLIGHMQRAIAFSRKTWGPHGRQVGVSQHIKKELKEIEVETSPMKRVDEWIDVVILGLDGAWRSLIPLSLSDTEMAQLVVSRLAVKQLKNESRDWPDWREKGEDEAIEHKRTDHEELLKAKEQAFHQAIAENLQQEKAALAVNPVPAEDSNKHAQDQELRDINDQENAERNQTFDGPTELKGIDKLLREQLKEEPEKAEKQKGPFLCDGRHYDSQGYCDNPGRGY